MNLLGRSVSLNLLLGWCFGVFPWSWGLRPGSGIFVWGFCGVGVSVGAVHDLALSDL